MAVKYEVQVILNLKQCALYSFTGRASISFSLMKQCLMLQGQVKFSRSTHTPKAQWEHDHHATRLDPSLNATFLSLPWTLLKIPLILSHSRFKAGIVALLLDCLWVGSWSEWAIRWRDSGAVFCWHKKWQLNGASLWYLCVSSVHNIKTKAVLRTVAAALYSFSVKRVGDIRLHASMTAKNRV